MTPSPRQITPATATTPSGRAMVRDVGAGNALPARFDVRTAFDFAISTTSDVGEHDELPAEDRKWLERARAALPDRVRPAVDSELGIFGTGLIVDRPDVTDAATFVELLRQTPGASSRTPSSPTRCATPPARPRSRLRWTATGRRSTPCSARGPSTSTAGSAGSSATRTRSPRR